MRKKKEGENVGRRTPRRKDHTGHEEKTKKNTGKG
jgi:hypothetical protein